jgi:exonuclease VII small subunit
MARIKRGSAVLETARQRLAGLKSINPKPNFGPALDIDQYEQEIETHSAKLDQYNETLSLLDRLQNELEEQEAALNDKNIRMLAATGALYGPDSNEYEAVGGTRKSDRKRPVRKKTGAS